ncbi:T9SS type A sorting domain-containing protein, partial [Flavobacterium sp.]|uniref:T9SS type A sorting domain-containing protein n=1 Tax=Flavobacterium sp. TaxID=239 RepID=UPI002FD93A62
TSSNVGTFNIRYHGGTTTTWATLEHVTLPYQLGNLTCGTTYEWQAQLICPNTVAGTTTTVSPWSTGGTFTTLACPPPPCNAPTGLSATNVSQTGAYLYLNPTSSNVGTFNIRYHGGTTTAWTTLEHVTLPYQLGNLTCGTTYEWQAQLICPNTVAGTTTTVSPWSTGGTFTTLACTPPPCTTPTGLSATNVSQTGAYLYLNPTTSNVGTFNIRYHNGTTTAWTTLEHVTLPYQLGNLTCGTTYEWQAQLICPNTVAGTTLTVSPWSTGGTFTTLACPPPPTCNAPTELTTSTINQTSAVLHWSAVNGAISYIVYYKKANIPFVTSTAVTAATNMITINGLEGATAYVWQVRAICSNGTSTTVGSSALSTAAVFLTPGLIIYPNPSNQLINVRYWVENAETTQVELRNNYGQLVFSSHEANAKGTNEFTIDSSGLSDGLYFLTLRSSSSNVTSKVLVKH